MSITGIGCYPTGRSRGSVRLPLRSNVDSTFSCIMAAEILPKLTGRLPSVQISHSSWDHFKDLTLADPKFMDPSFVDIILGADLYHLIIQEGLRKGNTDDPIAQLTCFGWIISGPVRQSHPSTHVQGYPCSGERDCYELLERFWQQEELLDRIPSLSPSDSDCEHHFKETHSRAPSGKYVVRLPLKDPLLNLGESKPLALSRLNRLFQRFKTDKPFESEYQKFLKDYLELGHMVQVVDDSHASRIPYYLPHHGVLPPTGAKGKLRVVFNGSSKSSNGTSLNDNLHTGSKLQLNLFDVLLWFRKFRYVFCTDIEKMYRQIMVHPDDWCLQRILWKDCLGNILTYNLTTVTYGLACAPFLALRTLNQLVEDEGSAFPLATPVLTRGRYVDDMFGGGDTVEQAQQVAQQLTQLCMAGGFPLRKWISNHPATLSNIPTEHQLPVTPIALDKLPLISALGMSWQPSDDWFQFSHEIPLNSSLTKRKVASQIARLFDPLGLVAPVMIKAKIFLQETWAVKIDWDDPLPTQLTQQWVEFTNQLSALSRLTIPRWIGITLSTQCQLHGFADASQSAMAAAVYLKTVEGAKVTTSLICSKTKVAPLKRLTTPRLELSAATLLTRLTSHVIQTLDLANIPTFLWTDSSIVHTWINSHPSKWKEYIHNRVCLIQETLPHAQWKLVPGNDNPADCASRGISSDEILTHPLWWSGPPWLSLEADHWPNGGHTSLPDDVLEIRPTVRAHVVCTSTTNHWNLLDRYSSLTKLLRVTALCQRVVGKFRRRYAGSITDPLTPEELLDAKHYWVRHVQEASFKTELELLSTGKTLPKQNPLVRLTPFVDNSGLLRLGGRLKNSILSYENKHPCILPRHSALSNLIISDAHQRTLHGSTQETLTFIRASCWIVGGRAPVRSFILRCVRCSILRQKTAQQLMGQLPATRVTPCERPFLNAGIDYAGPFIIKTWTGRAAKSYKAYIVLFVCLATSALHLEIVTDYSTEAFLAAYRRFTSRRGICATLTSDCGTNLKGADAELTRLFSRNSVELGRLSSLIANDGTKWVFGPPAAPHFGGKWEAGVKSVKYHLRRTIGDTRVTYEQLSTLLTQIEAILNSRPLCPLTDDPDDLSVLTPGHFLIGQPLTVIPEPTLAGANFNRLGHWQRLRQMLETFWTRWSGEYLQRYQARYKWNQPISSLIPGMIVLIKDERYPPSKWPLGRILKVHPGRDGLVRVATVKTQTTILSRPIVKLCPLPVSPNPD